LVAVVAPRGKGEVSTEESVRPEGGAGGGREVGAEGLGVGWSDELVQ